MKKRVPPKRKSNSAAKRVLVTGGAGFIGSAFLNVMVPRYPQYDFLNIDALTYAGDRSKIAVENAPNYQFAKIDIRDMTALKKIFRSFQPTHLVHFAAESHVDNSIERPRDFADTNVHGTLNLLDLARAHGLTRFHHISTDEVYGSIPLQGVPATEDAPLRPSSPYSASKAAADAFVLGYHTTYGLDVVITRSSNNYGPGQHREKFMPLFLRAFHAGKAAPLYGSGKNIRDWMYVYDHVEGIDRAFHKGKAGHIYNLGADNERRNIDVAKMLLKLVGNTRARIARVEDRPGHDLRYSIDSSMARRELGWKPLTPFENGIRETIVYYTTRS